MTATISDSRLPSSHKTRFAPGIRRKMVMLDVLAITFTLAGWWKLRDQQQSVIRETHLNEIPA